MLESNGWSKLSRPMYDQPLWQQNTSWFEPPTVRSVTSVIFDVAGTASGMQWISYTDDIIFAQM